MSSLFASWPPFAWSILISAMLLVGEALTGTLALLGLGIGMASVAIIQLCSGTLAPTRDTVVFLVASACSLIAARMVFRRRKDVHLAGDDINRY